VSTGYDEAELQRLLAEDVGTTELGIEVACREGSLVLMGEVESAERRDAIAAKVAEFMPGADVRNDIAITRTQAPADVEVLS
jgi:osmotically-inducible protein OsmY